MHHDRILVMDDLDLGTLYDCFDFNDDGNEA